MKVNIEYLPTAMAIMDSEGNLIYKNFSFKNSFEVADNIFDIILPHFHSALKRMIDSRTLLVFYERSGKKYTTVKNLYFKISFIPYEDDKFLIEFQPRNVEVIAEDTLKKKSTKFSITVDTYERIINFYLKYLNFFDPPKNIGFEETIEFYGNTLKSEGLISKFFYHRKEERQDFHREELEDFDYVLSLINGYVFYFSLNTDIPINIRHTILKSIETLLRLTSAHEVNKTSAKSNFEFWDTANALLIGMFHEINNPLTVALMQSEMLLSVYKSDETLGPKLLKIYNNLKKIISITKIFRDMVKQTNEVKKIDLLNLINNSIKFLEHKDMEKIYINIIPENWSPHYIYGNEADLIIVFTNLISNAIDSIQKANRERGIINIKISSLNDYYIVSIEDNGKGIPAEIISKIFEPFFTTKSRHGLGYGLYLVSSICKKYNIDISVESVPEKETVFSLKFKKFKGEEE
ncbi:HAMP domain-containing sensor histidine kinase [Marinitoga sp. 1138]|uniref:PAS domain-containing sensor histidine kinase n=1 Tax=Marinitoga sp. 1138 TaxID=1643334 RepID=UPI0015868E66|nr:HAMP domain-containing sensor histidine kinase [Marinitoga sp. 1138]NUU96898.1 hypothetical protein [Marinitoga sp. 1138]